MTKKSKREERREKREERRGLLLFGLRGASLFDSDSLSCLE